MGEYMQSSIYIYICRRLLLGSWMYCSSRGADITVKDFTAFLDVRRCKNWAHKISSWKCRTANLSASFSQSPKYLTLGRRSWWWVMRSTQERQRNFSPPPHSPVSFQGGAPLAHLLVSLTGTCSNKSLLIYHFASHWILFCAKTYRTMLLELFRAREMTPKCFQCDICIRHCMEKIQTRGWAIL